MLNSIQKAFLIPVLTLSTGLFLSLIGIERESDPGNIQYPEHLTGAFTGSFGEETCRSCHFDYDLNWAEGKLLVDGLPEKLNPGKMYDIKITIYREKMGKAGFQLSARFKNGTQAGRFLISENKRIMFTKQVPDSLQFVQHSANGIEPQSEGESSWVIQWSAPEVISDSVLFSVSANAANGDQSEFGDWIYNKEVVIK